MRIRLLKAEPDDSTSSKPQAAAHHPHTLQHHGYNSSHLLPSLLTIPSESLSHITSFLEPSSLLAISRTNTQLHQHVSDDNTWHRAFNCYFWGIGPENEIDGDRALLFRRTETSWKKEYVSRYNVLRRWEQSRSPTIAHTPHHSPVASMHLMSDRSNGPPLLTSSLQYGVVARSQPLTGKVLKGFLDASGIVNGFGIGNPNVEFTPNVSTCALSSDGGTARMIWGRTNGEVAVTTAARAMDIGRAAAKLTRCQVNDEHAAEVTDAIWVNGGIAFVTAAADGIVKVWDWKTMRCLWTSPKKEVIDPCVKIVADLLQGFIVSVMKSGELVIWAGLSNLLADDSHPAQVNPRTVTLRIPPLSTGVAGSPSPTKEPSTLLLDPSSTLSSLSLAIHYRDDSNLHRLTVDVSAQTWQQKLFSGGALGSIRSVFAIFATSPTDASAIFTGDLLGRVTVYNWSAHSSSSSEGVESISPSRKLDALDDGAITSLSANEVILATGSSRGTIKIWDSLTFALLRSFPSPLARPMTGVEWDFVGNILLERDLIVASVGSRVIAWKAGPIRERRWQQKLKRASKGKRGATTKWQEQYEMRREISESRMALDDEHASKQRIYDRERDQIATLNHLGLDETEALDYVLMLSRDDEKGEVQFGLGRPRSQSPEGSLFEGDLEDTDSTSQSRLHGTAHSFSPTPIPSSSSSYASSFVRECSSSGSYPSSSSLTKGNDMSTSSRSESEHMEAARGVSPSQVAILSSDQSSCKDYSGCPAISSTVGTVDNEQGSLVPMSDSPRAMPGMEWSTVLKSQPLRASLTTPKFHHSIMARTPIEHIQTSNPTQPSLLSASLARHGVSAENGRTSNLPKADEDADLQYALDLSFAESLSLR